MINRMANIKKFLATIRTPREGGTQAAKAGVSTLFLLLGLALGIFTKWLDTLALSDYIWWHRLLEATDLHNVFSMLPIWLLIALIIAIFSRSPLRAALNVFLFFAGMCTAYHLCSIIFSGFDPGSYMTVWYGITLLSPLIAAFSWYGKGNSATSIVICALIIAVMTILCFSIGRWYISFNGLTNALIFIAALIVLYRDPKQIAISVAAGLILAFLFGPMIPYVS